MILNVLVNNGRMGGRRTASGLQIRRLEALSGVTVVSVESSPWEISASPASIPGGHGAMIAGSIVGANISASIFVQTQLRTQNADVRVLASPCRWAP